MSDVAAAVADLARERTGSDEAAQLARSIYEGTTSASTLGENVARENRARLAEQFGIEYDNLEREARFAREEADDGQTFDTDADDEWLGEGQVSAPTFVSSDPAEADLRDGAVFVDLDSLDRNTDLPRTNLYLVPEGVAQFAEDLAAHYRDGTDVADLAVMPSAEYDAFEKAREQLREDVQATTDLTTEEVEDLSFSALQRLADGPEGPTSSAAPAPRSGDLEADQRRPGDRETEAIDEMTQGKDWRLAKALRRIHDLDEDA